MQAEFADADRRPRTRRLSTRHAAGALGVLIVLGIVALKLFDGITTVGISGVDTFSYVNDTLALRDPSSDMLRRLPADEGLVRVSVFTLDLLAVKLFGVNDYALRAMVGAMQLATIGLLYLLGLRVAREPLLALAAATLYALNPLSLRYASSELPTVYAAFFVALSAYAALLALDPDQTRRIRAAAAAGTGFFAACAATAHEDLILFAAGLATLGIAFVIADARRRPGGWRKPAAVLAASFAAGFVAGTAVPMLATGIGPQRLFGDLLAFHGAMSGNTAQRTDGSFLRFAALVPARLLGEMAVTLIGLPLAGLTVIVAAAAPLRRGWAGSRRLRETAFLFGATGFYLVTFILGARIYLEGDYARILLPLLGPILAATIAGGAELCAGWLAPVAGERRAAPLAIGLGLALAAATLPLYPAADAPAGRSLHRVLYETTSDLVSPDKRLLLPACYAVYRPWVGVGSPVYLGDGAVALRRLETLAPFATLVADNKIKYVLVLSDYRYRRLAEPAEIKRLFATVYGLTLPAEVEQSLAPAAAIRRPAAWWLPRAAEAVFPGDARVQWSAALCGLESDWLRRRLIGEGAAPVRTVPEMGDVYALP